MKTRTKPGPEDTNVVFKAPMLQALTPDMRQQFLGCVTIREFGKRDVVFREGDAASSFYIVVRGWVQLFRIDAAGKEAGLGLFGPGESFGEAAMFLGRRFPVGALAAEPIRLARVDAEAIMALLRENNGLCFALLGSMSLHLHQLVNRLSSDRLQKASLRLAAFLVDLHKGGEEGGSISLPYDKAVLASTLGMVPEALSRSFGELKSMGVEVDGREIRLTNVAALRALVNGGID